MLIVCSGCLLKRFVTAMDSVSVEINEGDLDDLPDEIRQVMTFIPVDQIDQALEVAPDENIPRA